MDNTLIFNIALLIVAAALLVYLFKQFVLFVSKRPDLVALLAGTGIIVGSFMLSSPAQQANALIIIATGATLLMMAALNYRHYQGGK